MMAQHRQPLIARGREPVELNHAPLADKRLMAMPGVARPLESNKGALSGRDFKNNVADVVARAQQAQAAARIFPAGIHIDEYGDDLAQRIRVDSAVARAAPTAHRNRARPSRQINVKFPLEGCAELIGLELIEEARKCRPVGNPVDWKAAPLRYLRIILVDCVE